MPNTLPVTSSQRDADGVCSVCREREYHDHDCDRYVRVPTLGMATKFNNPDDLPLIHEIAADLDVLQAKAARLDLFVEGREFHVTLKAVSRQLTELAAKYEEQESKHV